MKIQHLSKIYKTRYEDVKALEDINLLLPKKGLVFIVGVSGSGKTTLMNMLSGVDTPTTGDISIGKKSLFGGSKNDMFGYRNSYVGLVFQDYNLIEDLNVYDNIKLPFELLGETDFSRVDEVIKKVDIEEIKYSKVTEISSGQMQRVAIARALIKDSSMILADEPTGNLDTKNEKIVFDLLKEISQERLVIVITHGEQVAQIYGDRIIEIEDGNIVADNHPMENVEQETPTFIQPRLNFSQQVRFTKGFIRNNIARSLSVMLVLLLIPLLGGILSGYVFYDVAVGYKDYQEKYNSQYLSLSQPVDHFDMYYTAAQYSDLRAKYPGTNFMEQYDANININPNSLKDDLFYRPAVEHINIFNTNLVESSGRVPELEYEIVVTDYVLDAIKHYQGVEEVTHMEIYGNIYEVVGVIDTDYETFLGSSLATDAYRRMAFEENLGMYNAVYTSYLGLLVMNDTMKTYTETVKYTVYTGKSNPETHYSDVTVKRGTEGINQSDLVFGTGSLDLNQRYGMISSALYEKIAWDAQDVKDSSRLIFFSYSKAKYRIDLRVSDVFYSDDLVIVLHSKDFDRMVSKHFFSRLLVSKDDVNYDEIVRNENVTNESYNHAANMRSKADGSRIAMIEFLVVLVIIIIAFSSIINSMTLNTEKKKIGIKFSFGLKKTAIIIPYILEVVLYILIGFVISSVIVKYLFPVFMQSVVYTKEADIRAFDFFYISWTSIVGWDLLVYLLMLVNLTVMVLTIVRKSPIEIIKDL